MPPKFDNRHDAMAQTLAAEARSRRDALTDSIRGGPTPPGTVQQPMKAMLSDYLLLCQDENTLVPEERKRRERLIREQYGQRDRADVAEWHIAMTKLMHRFVPNQPGLDDAQPQMDWSGALGLEPAATGGNDGDALG
jgi:hypothetical protein